MLDTFQALLENPLPTVRYTLRTGVLDQDEHSSELQALRNQIADSEPVQTLLSERTPQGTINRHPYDKWRGTHWVLVALADLNYPTGDETLLPLRQQALDWIFSDEVRVQQTARINGVYRRHASQEGNLLHALIRLGLVGPELDDLAEMLLKFQWPDGGWNCDKKRSAHASSFTHTSLALRGLLTYAQIRPDAQVAAAIHRAREVLLERRLFRRRSTGEIIRPEFMQLTVPDYHFYTYFLGLKIMSQGGWLDDPRCAEALDLLQGRWLPGEGLALDKQYYQTAPSQPRRFSNVRWAKYQYGRANTLLTSEALVVLKRAGRFKAIHP